MKKITIHTLFITVHALKNIKNGSHDNIHTFKNYFVTVLSVFSFSNNKLNPNGPIVYQLYQLGNSKKKNKITKVAMGVLRVLFFFFFFFFFFFEQIRGNFPTLQYKSILGNGQQKENQSLYFQ